MYIVEFARSLTDVQRHQIIQDWYEFERKGAIGDCALREQATIFCSQLQNDYLSIVVWMEKLSSACFRVYYEKHYPINLEN